MFARLRARRCPSRGLELESEEEKIAGHRRKARESGRKLKSGSSFRLNKTTTPLVPRRRIHERTWARVITCVFVRAQVTNG